MVHIVKAMVFPVVMYGCEYWTIKKVKSLSCVRLLATPWTAAYQAPPSMGFCRQEYWSGLPFPSPGDLPDPGMEPRSLALQADTLTSEPPRSLMDSVGEGEGGKIWENGIETCKISCMK